MKFVFIATVISSNYYPVQFTILLMLVYGIIT